MVLICVMWATTCMKVKKPTLQNGHGEWSNTANSIPAVTNLNMLVTCIKYGGLLQG